MPQQLLWVDNRTGQQQGQQQGLGDSARQRQARIRSHVQSHRSLVAERRLHTGLAECQEDDLQPSDCVKDVLAMSLRPSRSLGRLAVKSTDANSTRKRRKGRKDGLNRPYEVLRRNPDAVLTRNPPFLWHGLSSSERASLSFFQLRTSQEWSGWEDASFWNVFVLQISQQSETVARSLIAVSALHERMGALGSVEHTRLHNLSCEQSGRATTALLARSNISYFEALVSCLIMTCFHGLQRSRTSFMLLRSGLKLLEECNFPGRASFEERRLIDFQIRPLFSRLLSKPCTMVDMSKAFILSIERQRGRCSTLFHKSVSVPQDFNALSKARDCLRDILDWAHDNHPFPAHSAISMHAFLHKIRELTDAWKLSLARSNFPKTAHSVRSRRLLEAACLVGMIIANTAHCIEETFADEYQAEFQEILSLVESSWLSGHSFGIDAGLVDIIAFVGCKCRDPYIRRQALQLLKSGSRLEGDRVVSNAAMILDSLITLEERNVKVTTFHDVPERNRRRLIYGQQHVAQGLIKLFYASSDGSLEESCFVSMGGSTIGKASKKTVRESDNPNAIFSTGSAAYLESSQVMSYFRIDLDRFYFPIPKF